MLAALIICVVFNGYDNCMHGDNLAPWNAWDNFSFECKSLTAVFVLTNNDILEKLCVENRNMAGRFSKYFKQRLLAKMRSVEACGVDIAFFEDSR